MARRSSFALAVALAGAAPAGSGDAPAPWRVVPQERLVEAMGEVRSYDLTATANGPRLQADVVLALVRDAQAQDPERRPLLIGHREWFFAFLARTGLTPDRAPLYVRRPYEVGQDLVVDFRQERVVEAVLEGGRPQVAANVWISWVRAPGKPREYSYDDPLASPTLRVTQKRLITYRLLDYGDRRWYAQIEGLHGRPTSGALGVLFDLIGEAQVLESRSAVAQDAAQVVRGRARKWGIDRTETVTVWPNGHADRGVPGGRADLRALEARLREPLAARFRPLPAAAGE
jgi:hypothetical protein